MQDARAQARARQLMRSQQRFRRCAMRSNERPVIAVVGATGVQGGGLVRAILDDPAGRFSVRALTRDPRSPRARALAEAGAEVVRADLDDLDTLVTAFAGVHGVFGVTNFWEHMDPVRESAQAANIAQAAGKAGVRHAVWSTLEDVRRFVPAGDDRIPTLMGQYKVPHMDAKAEADACFADSGMPTTYLLTSFYWENLLQWALRETPQGGLVLALPIENAALPGIAGADIGACALGIFARGEQLAGQRIGVAGEHLDGETMAYRIATAQFRPVRYDSVPYADFAAAPIPGAAELANMFRFKVEFNGQYRAARPVDAARDLHPGLSDFTTWLRANGMSVAAR
jgi:uncharacterized protein YbjT (DUF2867 family)